MKKITKSKRPNSAQERPIRLKRYKAERIRNSALWRLYELRPRKGERGGPLFICIAIGNPELKYIAARLSRKK